jgi:hypothetical protein
VGDSYSAPEISQSLLEDHFRTFSERVKGPDQIGVKISFEDRVIAESVPKRTLRLNLWHLLESLEIGLAASPA